MYEQLYQCAPPGTINGETELFNVDIMYLSQWVKTSIDLSADVLSDSHDGGLNMTSLSKLSHGLSNDLVRNDPIMPL